MEEGRFRVTLNRHVRIEARELQTNRMRVDDDRHVSFDPLDTWTLVQHDTKYVARG
jgi:hypothetical protein